MNCVEVKMPITIIEGGTYEKTYQFLIGTPAVPVNLAGFAAQMMVRARITESTPLITVPNRSTSWIPDAETGIYILSQQDADLGKFRVYIKDEDTRGISPSHRDINGVWDLLLTSAAGETILRLYGTAVIRAAVTR